MHPVVIVCDALEILGTAILLALLVITILPSSKIRRAPTWYLFIFAALLSSASTLLIMGRQTGEAPNQTLCLTQVALIYSSSVYVALSAAAFTLQIYLTMISIENIHLYPVVQYFLIYILPALISAAALVITLLVGIQHPSSIQRVGSSNVRCSLLGYSVTRISASVGIAGVVLALLFEAIIALKIRRSWRTYEITLTESGTSRNVLVRVFVFTLLALILLGVGLLAMLPSLKTNEVVYCTYNIAIASLPAGAGLVFGTQRDILSVLGIWKYTSSGLSSDSSEAQSSLVSHNK